MLWDSRAVIHHVLWLLKKRIEIHKQNLIYRQHLISCQGKCNVHQKKSWKRACVCVLKWVMWNSYYFLGYYYITGIILSTLKPTLRPRPTRSIGCSLNNPSSTLPSVIFRKWISVFMTLQQTNVFLRFQYCCFQSNLHVEKRIKSHTSVTLPDSWKQCIAFILLKKIVVVLHF